MAANIGTFADLLEMTEADLRPVVEKLRAIVFEVHPEAVEVVRLGDRAATYGVGPRKMIDGYAYVLPYREWANLGFYQGVDLPDPDGLLDGTGANMRHVKVRTVAEADDGPIRTLIEVALKQRQATLG